MGLLKKRFFELGIAFAQFSAKTDQENYQNARNIALSLELEFPTFIDLKDNTWWDFVPPAKWFNGSNGESFRNCYEIGILTYLRFLLALPPNPNTQTDQVNQAEQKLKELFKSEAIEPKALDDYFTALNTDNTNEVNDSLRTFVRYFSTVFPSDNEIIFDNLCSPSSAFDCEVSEMLQLTIDETSICYKNECYLATIALCGKIIETLLANAFHALMGKFPPEKMGFGEIRAALRGKGMPLDDTVDELLQLIYTHRSVVIHRGNLRKTSFPTEGQAKHVAGLTQEVINTIYNYFNDQ